MPRRILNCKKYLTTVLKLLLVIRVGRETLLATITAAAAAHLSWHTTVYVRAFQNKYVNANRLVRRASAAFTRKHRNARKASIPSGRSLAIWWSVAAHKALVWHMLSWRLMPWCWVECVGRWTAYSARVRVVMAVSWLLGTTGSDSVRGTWLRHWWCMKCCSRSLLLLEWGGVGEPRPRCSACPIEVGRWARHAVIDV